MRSRAGHEVPRRPARRAAGSSAAAGIELFSLDAAQRSFSSFPLHFPAMLSLAHAGTAIASAFVASLVEAVEALTIVLAVGTMRGWRPALAGTVAGLAFLALLVLRSEEHTSELQSRRDLVCRLLLEKKK